jgi:hypothetical protein
MAVVVVLSGCIKRFFVASAEGSLDVTLLQYW